MEILGQIEGRRAYRALDEKAIPREALRRLAEAAHLAPSFGNSQSWRILIAVDPARLASLKAALTPGNYWAKKAPAIAAFVTSPEWDGRLDGGRDYALFDLGQASMAFQIQAQAEGLVAHPIAGFDAGAAKAALGLPAELVLATLVVLGYRGDPAGLSEKHLAAESSPRSRRALDEVFAFDAWDERLAPVVR